MAALLEYKCPACGGAISFDSTLQKMKCPYCNTEFDVETLKSYDDALKSQQPDNMQWDTVAGSEWKEGESESISVYVCDSCGGEIVCDANTAATSCPYCDNPVIMTGKLSGVLRPDYVIPFKLDKNAAKQGLVNHLKGKRLLPKVFKDQNHIDEIKGVYVPFWLFDADVDADVHFSTTTTRMWSDSRYNYTETRYYSILRSGKIGFDRVPVDGSSKMPDDLMESIEPYDFSGAVDFQTAYLAGYLADTYDVTAEQSIQRANDRIKSSTEEAFTQTVQGYDSVTCESSRIDLSNGKTKYALYPVWLLNTTWNNKRYTFAMNGQTGKFVGNLPVNWKAFWAWFASLTVGCGAVTFLIQWLIRLIQIGG